MYKLLVCAVLFVALSTAQDCTPGTGSYKTTFGSIVTWQVDCNAQTISIVHTVTSFGWVGVGWNTQAAMAGADVVFGWLSDSQHVLDVKNGDHVPPTLSSVQTATNKSISVNDGVITLSFTKPLVTTDTAGISITPSTTLFLLAATAPTNPTDDDISQATAHFSAGGDPLMDVTSVNFFAVPSSPAPSPTPAPAPTPTPTSNSNYGSGSGWGSTASTSTSGVFLTGVCVLIAIFVAL